MAAKITKNISLTPHFERMIEEKVRSGRYHSASEVVREGLRLIEEREAARQEVRGMIEKGWQEASRGEGRDGPTVMKEARQGLIKRLKSRQKTRDHRSKA